ncbi:MAG: helix-hairpin-helix domain-containing protein [Candidatus Thermoplasmatota archaeon]
MDLTSVRGVDKDVARGLGDAGILTVADLARSRMAPPELVEAAQELIIRTFHEAGAGTEAELADANTDDLAAKTGMHRNEVLWFQEAAREALGLLLTHRVILVDGQPTANVVLPQGERQGVPILTARAKEDADKVLSSLTGNAVLLREGESTAIVRVDGAMHEGLPLFRLKPDRTERRVRVQELRERKVIEKQRSLLLRMLGR